jgi:hypothetical protein
MASVGRAGKSVKLTSHYLIKSFHGLRGQSRYPPGILLWRDGWIETSFQLPCTISRRYGSRPFLFHLSEKDCCLKSWIRRDCPGQGSARCVRTSPRDIISSLSILCRRQSCMLSLHYMSAMAQKGASYSIMLFPHTSSLEEHQQSNPINISPSRPLSQ